MLTATKKHKTEIKARIYRANTGKWEDLGMIYESKVGVLQKLKNLIKKWLQ